MPENFVAELTEQADDAWITANGAQWWLVHGLTSNIARACLLTARGSRELGFEFPEHHRNLLYSRTRPPFTT